jgi:hypothetical protein
MGNGNIFVMGEKQMASYCRTCPQVNQKHSQDKQTTTNILRQSPTISLFQTKDEIQAYTQGTIQETQAIVPFDMEI